MNRDIELALFDIQLTRVDIENLRTTASIENKNTTETENIFRQIASELDRLKAVEALQNPDQNAQLSEIKYIKKELERLVLKLESELANDKTGKLFFKLLAKIRG